MPFLDIYKAQVDLLLRCRRESGRGGVPRRADYTHLHRSYVRKIEIGAGK